jgi:type VI secretion system protein ImpC
METLLERLQATAADHPPSLPLRLLVVADCGRSLSGPVEADVSNVEALMAALQPAVSISVENRLLEGGPKVPVELQIRRLADFHPESLVSKVEILAQAARSGHDSTGEQLDEILHHPEFQRLEACWRGLERLFRTVPEGRGVLLEVLPATRKNLAERFHQLVYEPEYSGAAEIPLSSVYFDFRFSHEPVDLPLLESLADDCAALQTPMIGAVLPAFFQLRNLAHLPNLPDLAGKFQLPAYAGWRRFQTSPSARWVCLTANRYLSREPYALSTESASTLNYREKADAAHPEMYLWGEAGWLVLANLVRSFAKYRHCVVIDGMDPETAQAGLPVRPFPKKANVTVPSPTEILIDDDKAWEIVRGGVTMLVGISDGAVATFPFICNVYRLRPGVMTTESALSYQLFAGHLSHFLMNLYGEIPVGGDAEALVAFVKEKLREFMIPLGGEQSEESVQATLAEIAGDSPQRVLNLTLKPILKIQGKDVDFTLQLALRE